MTEPVRIHLDYAILRRLSLMGVLSFHIMWLYVCQYYQPLCGQVLRRGYYQLEVVPEDCARIRRTILVLYAAYGGLTAKENV